MTKHTRADFEALEEGTLVQLINGELIMSPAPRRIHQRIILEVGSYLNRFVKSRKLGEVNIAPFDVYLTETEAYQPDILYVSNERFSILNEHGAEGAPDLVVEVLSPSTGYYDLRHKKRIYEQTGVREYWILDPFERTVEVFVREDDAFVQQHMVRANGTVTSSVLDGFEIELEVFFA